MRVAPTVDSVTITHDTAPKTNATVYTTSCGMDVPAIVYVASMVVSTALAIEVPTVRTMELTLLATPVSLADTSAISRFGTAANARLTKTLTAADAVITCHVESRASAKNTKPAVPRPEPPMSTARAPNRLISRPAISDVSAPSAAPGSR
jgi:hypothetical protein